MRRRISPRGAPVWRTAGRWGWRSGGGGSRGVRLGACVAPGVSWGDARGVRQRPSFPCCGSENDLCSCATHMGTDRSRPPGSRDQLSNRTVQDPWGVRGVGVLGTAAPARDLHAHQKACQG
jgi:hypothetical protein